MGSFSSISALDSALDSVLSNMANKTYQPVYCEFSANASPFISGLKYIGMLNRQDYINYASCIFSGNSGVAPIVGSKSGSNGWSFDVLALNSSLVNKNITQHSAVSKNTWVDDVFSLPTPSNRAILNGYNGTGAFFYLIKRSDSKIYVSEDIASNDNIYLSGVIT